MRTTLKWPGISPAVSQLLTHVTVVFLTAFGGQLVAGATGAITSMPTLLALLTAAAAAGVTAVAHYALGLIPTPTPAVTAAVVPLKIPKAVQQVIWSTVIVFLTAFGAQLVAGASKVVSIPTLVALVAAGCAAAVTAAVQALLKLVPVPVVVSAVRAVSTGPASMGTFAPPVYLTGATFAPPVYLTGAKGTPSLKLGKLTAYRPPGLRDLVGYAKTPLPSVPDKVSIPKTTYAMDGNDQVGDCTLAGACHVIVAANAQVAMSDPVPADTEVIDQYYAITGGQDTGCVEADVLKLWHTKGLFGGNKIAGYAPVNPRDVTAIKQAIAFYGAAYIGVALPQSAQQQFGAGQPWTVVPGSPILGGHCIVLVGYDTTYVQAVTWGAVVNVTWEWLGKYCDEAWAILTREIVEAGYDALHIDLTELRADLASV
jgi:hypothetical protein